MMSDNSPRRTLALRRALHSVAAPC